MGEAPAVSAGYGEIWTSNSAASPLNGNIEIKLCLPPPSSFDAVGSIHPPQNTVKSSAIKTESSCRVWFQTEASVAFDNEREP